MQQQLSPAVAIVIVLIVVVLVVAIGYFAFLKPKAQSTEEVPDSQTLDREMRDDPALQGAEDSAVPAEPDAAPQ